RSPVSWLSPCLRMYCSAAASYVPGDVRDIELGAAAETSADQRLGGAKAPRVLPLARQRPFVAREGDIRYHRRTITGASMKPAAGEIKLRVAFCGICGSDMHEYESAQPPRVLGLMQPVMGHEFTGTIVALGEGVMGFGIGQNVTGNPGAGCGNCRYCAAGREN